MEKKIWSAELTQKGLISLWENGNGYHGYGRVNIITTANSSKPTAVYICKNRHLKEFTHALVPVHSGYFVIESFHHHENFTHKLFEITRTFTEGGEGKVELILRNTFEQGKWDIPLPNKFNTAIATAEKRAVCSNLTKPFYVHVRN